HSRSGRKVPRTIDQASGPDSRTIPLAAGPGGLATAAIVSLGSSAASMVPSRLQVLRPDALIRFAQAIDGSRSQGIPIGVSNARWNGTDVHERDSHPACRRIRRSNPHLSPPGSGPGIALVLVAALALALLDHLAVGLVL